MLDLLRVPVCLAVLAWPLEVGDVRVGTWTVGLTTGEAGEVGIEVLAMSRNGYGRSLGQNEHYF